MGMDQDSIELQSFVLLANGAGAWDRLRCAFILGGIMGVIRFLWAKVRRR